MEFEERPVFPPPLIILAHGHRTVKYLRRWWQGRPRWVASCVPSHTHYVSPTQVGCVLCSLRPLIILAQSRWVASCVPSLTSPSSGGLRPVFPPPPIILTIPGGLHPVFPPPLIILAQPRWVAFGVPSPIHYIAPPQVGPSFPSKI